MYPGSCYCGQVKYQIDDPIDKVLAGRIQYSMFNASSERSQELKLGGPLSGYKVLELTTTVSGPMTGMVLSDQGAEIIKVEPPLLGDMARYLGSKREGLSAIFAVLNRNKRSIVLDLKEQKDLDIFKTMVKEADVLLENYRPGIVKKLGIDYESLKAINPSLIYTSISGYGQDGPYKNRKVYDPLIQATAGVSETQGAAARGEPRNMASIIFDKVTALTTAQAITAALLERVSTGEGKYLSVSMLDAALYYSWPDIMWSRTLLADDVEPTPPIEHFFQVYKAKDKFVTAVLQRDEDLEVFCIWLGSELHKDPRFLTFADRVENADSFKQEIEKLIANLDAEEIANNLDAFNIPVAVVNLRDEVHLDPQVQHNESLIEAEHPVLGKMRYPKPPVNFGASAPFPARHAPFLGDHTREILSELGVDEDNIQRLELRDAQDRETVAAMQAEQQRLAEAQD